ncbi:hypothetical protein ACLB2K_021121 [Fragaria x ananassa]
MNEAMQSQADTGLDGGANLNKNIQTTIGSQSGVKCPPQKEKGTTIACAIGTDEMYYCGDGRAVSIYEEVISGDGVKHVDQDGINVKKSLKRFRSKWKRKHPGKIFEAEMMIFGNLRGTNEMYYCGDGRAVSIYEEVISGDGVKHVDQDGINVKKSLKRFRSKWKRKHPGQIFEAEMMIFGNLRGGRQAHVHLVRFLVGDLTREDYMRIVSEAITIAVLFDPHTGGHIETCAFGQTPTCNFGYLVKEKRHAMKNLALYFTVIEEAGHLDNCLIFMTEGLLYTRLAERVSAEKIGIIVRDAESIESINILGVNLIKGVTIRLIRFRDIVSAHAAYTRLSKVGKKDWDDDDYERSESAIYSITNELVPTCHLMKKNLMKYLIKNLLKNAMK